MALVSEVWRRHCLTRNTKVFGRYNLPKKAAAIKTTEAATIKWGAGISSLDAKKRSSKPEGSSNLKDTCLKPFRMEKEHR